MGISIKQAVSTGAWYHCQLSGCWDDYSIDKITIDLRIRIESFERINLNEVDGVENIKLNLKDGELWILKLEVVNFYKKTLDSFPIYDSIILVADECNLHAIWGQVLDCESWDNKSRYEWVAFLSKFTQHAE